VKARDCNTHFVCGVLSRGAVEGSHVWSLKGFIFDYSSVFVLCVPQVLLTLCTCCFTVTVGAYACILQGEEMSSPKGNELTGAWGMQLYCAAIFILLILISGQLVTNAVRSFCFYLYRRTYTYYVVSISSFLI